MKRTFKDIKANVVAASLALALSPAAQAAVITFEGGGGSTFTYSGVVFQNGLSQPTASGYFNVATATGSNTVALNPSEFSPSSFAYSGAPDSIFTLNSFVIAGAWGSQTLTVKGYNNGNHLYTGTIFVTNVASVFNAEWSGIDQFTIATGSDHIDLVEGGAGQHWALDNLTINAVPEPETYAMMLAGLSLICGVACRRKQKLAA